MVRVWGCAMTMSENAGAAGEIAIDEGYRPLKVKKVDMAAPSRWLSAGWRDFRRRPFFGMFYGLLFVLLCWGSLLFLVLTGMERMIGPALAGAMLIGPLIATGLYRASRRQLASERGGAAVGEQRMNYTQVALMGAILMTLVIIWIRAAVIIYALFFGLVPYPGFMETITQLFFTPNGLMMLGVGSAVGGLFAALTFAISAFSFPMMVDEDVDAFTAMGSSFVGVTRNFWPMVKWGAIISLLTAFGFATALVAMIIIFPVLGHATWHAYDEVFRSVQDEG